MASFPAFPPTQVVITAAPECLALTILRFGFDTKTSQRTKMLDAVTCPRILTVPVGQADQPQL